MKVIGYILVISLISSCGKISAPSLLSPSQNYDYQTVSYGPPPVNYQKVLKDYLIKNIKDHETAKVEFINEPAKLTIDHLGDTYSGFRVCLSINEKRGDHYIGYRNHFFMINDSNINLHLYDSGLLTIPFEYCVTRDTSKEIFIEDIPDEKEEITVDKMDDVIITKRDDSIPLIGNIYIACNFNDKERIYVFNESKNTFKMIDKLDETIYSVNYNEAFIVASLSDLELSINRVTGKATLLENEITNGSCELTDKTKF